MRWYTKYKVKEGVIVLVNQPEALNKGLTDKEKKVLDTILQEDDDLLDKGRQVLVKSAEQIGRRHDNITLHRHQVIPILMMQVSKRVLNGFSPGIGKTYSSCGAYALYRMKQVSRGLDYSRLLVVTEGSHIKGMERDFNKGGVKLLPLSGGSIKVQRQLNKFTKEGKRLEDEYDGLVISWDTLKTNAFLLYFMENAEKYKFGIFDETSSLMNKTTILYEVANNVINKYDKGMDNVMFLNGTVFSKNIYDIYNQMNVLNPRLLPSKRWVDDNYVVKDNKEIWKNELFNNKGKMMYRRTRTSHQEIVNYKNQEDFRAKIRYYYIQKNKSDIKDIIPENNYRLHMMPLTPKLRKIVDTEGALGVHKLNSPGTSSNGKDKLNRTHYPKFDYLINRMKETKSDRPVVYCLHRKSVSEIKKALEKEGFKTGVINGELSSEEKDGVIQEFNTGKLDTVVFNIEKAINLPSSDRMIFYNIPTTPLSTNQIKARIDRNNYTTPKFYDFLCYEDTQEVGNIARLGFFRETHGKALTGQGDDKVYSTLVDQLKDFYSQEELETVGQKINSMYDNNLDWEDIEQDIYDVLGI